MSETVADWVYDVSEADFEARVLDESQRRPVVVDFWAPWCQPCRLLGPLLEKLVAERKGAVVLAKINVDDNPALAEAFRIEGIPAVKAVRGGRLALEFKGVLPEEHLRAFLDKLAPPPEGDRQLNQAEALETRDPAAAERSYRRLLEKEPNNDAARVGLARVLLHTGRLDEIDAVLDAVNAEGELAAEAARIRAQATLKRRAQPLGDEAAVRARVTANPADAQALVDLGTVLAARGQYEPALQNLLAAAERDFKLANGPAREAMVQVFYALGPSHPLSDEYRAKLARLLF